MTGPLPPTEIEREVVIDFGTHEEVQPYTPGGYVVVPAINPMPKVYVREKR